MELIPLSVWEELASRYVEIYRLCSLWRPFGRDKVERYRRLFSKKIVSPCKEEWRLPNGMLHSPGEDLPCVVHKRRGKVIKEEWYHLGKMWRGGGKPCSVSVDGEMEWRDEEGRLHREGGEPAKISGSGSKSWYRRGEILYAERSNGIKIFYWKGRVGRDPSLDPYPHAIELPNGTKLWRKGGYPSRPHRLPTEERVDGTKKWFDNEGRLHNDYGPAVIYPDLSTERWRSGERVYSK